MATPAKKSKNCAKPLIRKRFSVDFGATLYSL